MDFEVKGLRFNLRPTPERCLFSKVTVLVTAFRAGKGNLCCGKRKLNAGIRSELQPSAEVNSGHLDLSSLKECGDVSVQKVSGNIESDDRVDLDHGSGSMDFPNGSGGNGKFPPGGGGGDDGDNSDDYKEEEFGPLLKYEEVIKEVDARGARLPSDMLEAAKASGIQKLLLYRYLDLQVFLNCEFMSNNNISMLKLFNLFCDKMEGISLAYWCCNEVVCNLPQPDAC